MPCTSPIPAWRSLSNGEVTLKEPDISVALRNLEARSIYDRREYSGYENLHLPCSRCLGCRMSKAREWAVRCTLESQLHETQSFVTLTYAPEHCPVWLNKAHLSGWLKRVRARLDTRIKFFACGEYGERTGRPHYHALVFGASDAPLFQSAWPFGFVRVDPVTPASIAYVAGYVSKKMETWQPPTEWVDEDTGEIITPQREFRLMSRGGRGKGSGGIAHFHRDSYPRSWRKEVIWQGLKVPVPRYLHERWKASATPEQLEQLAREKKAAARVVSTDSLAGSARRNEVRQEIKSSRRRKL